MLSAVGKQVLRDGEHFADARDEEAAAYIVALEQRVKDAESLLIEMKNAATIAEQAIAGACDTFGYLHACMFGAEQHLRTHGWVPVDKPAVGTGQIEEVQF